LNPKEREDNQEKWKDGEKCEAQGLNEMAPTADFESHR
jgi:hypothetical protein